MLENEPILQAVASHINDYTDTGSLEFTAVTDPDNFETGLIIVEPIISPTPESLTWEGAYDRAEATVQVTVIAETPTIARLVGDKVRTALAGKTGRSYTHPLKISGRTISSVTSNYDGSVDYDARTGQWTERYTIQFQ